MGFAHFLIPILVQMDELCCVMLEAHLAGAWSSSCNGLCYLSFPGVFIVGWPKNL